MDSNYPLVKWVIRKFSTISDEVCSKTFKIGDYNIQLSSKNFKYLFFPFNIKVKIKINSPSKKRKKIRAKISLKIRNAMENSNLLIQEEVIFRSPEYEYVVKTGLTQENLCDDDLGWVSNDKIKIYFKIEFKKSQYYETSEFEEEESKFESEQASQDESESESESEEIIRQNYYDFKIYDFMNEISPVLKFNNFEIKLSARTQNNYPVIIFDFFTRQKVKILFTFKLLNFKYEKNFICELQKRKFSSEISYHNNTYSKKTEIIFERTSIDEIEDSQNGFLKYNQYAVLNVRFYNLQQKEEYIQRYDIRSMNNAHYYQDYSLHSNYNYHNPRIDLINNNNNNSSSNYRYIYRDTSKEDTGYVGLQNQGATCYMNSLLQSLFHIPAFRKIVYNMPTSEQDDIKTSIPLCLQRLFAKLQFSSENCSTKELTTSFGWNDHQTFIQHDVQEFCTVLIDKLSEKMKGTPLENSLSSLLGGKFKSYIRCVDVDYESSKIEDFFDLSMIVKGCADLKKSFETYVEPEHLDGDNQYKTDEYGPQNAIMGTEFIQFPPILHIHLRRFEFDYQTMRMTKINDKFEFPLSIDLGPYMANNISNSQSNEDKRHDNNEGDGENQTKNEDDGENQMKNEDDGENQMKNEDDGENQTKNEDDDENQMKNEDDGESKTSDSIYDLYGVLVHSGSISGGHYFAFLRTSTSPQWFKFNDSRVSKASISEAVEDNFGGSSGSYSEKSYSAYMLVYIRRNQADEIMEPINEDDIPAYLVKYAKGVPSSSNKNENANENGGNNESQANEIKSLSIVVFPEIGIKFNSILGLSGYSINKLCKKIIMPDMFPDTDNNNNNENSENKSMNKLTHKLVYDRVSQELNIDRNSFRLLLFLGNLLYLVFQDDDQTVEKDMIFFVQNKPLDSTVDITSYSSQGVRNIIFMKFFYPLAEFPFYYIGTKELPKNEPISFLFPFVRDAIGLSEDAELNVYQQYSSYYHPVDSSSFCNIQCQNYLFQLKPGQILPENSKFPFYTIEEVASMNFFKYLDDKTIAQFELEHGVKITITNVNADQSNNANINEDNSPTNSVDNSKNDNNEVKDNSNNINEEVNTKNVDEAENSNIVVINDDKAANNNIINFVDDNMIINVSYLDFKLFKYDNLMNISINQTIEEYASNKKETIFANLYNYNQPYSKPFARIAFPSTITLLNLKSFIARILQIIEGINLGYNNALYAPIFHSIEIFKSANKSPKSKEPNDKPIILHSGIPNISSEFRFNNGYNIDSDNCQNLFVQVFPGTPEITVENQMFSVIALFAESGVKIIKSKVLNFLVINNDNVKNVGKYCIDVLQYLLTDQKEEEPIIPIEIINTDDNNDIKDEFQIDINANNSVVNVIPDKIEDDNISTEKQDLIDDGETVVNENEVSNNTVERVNDSNELKVTDEDKTNDKIVVMQNSSNEDKAYKNTKFDIFDVFKRSRSFGLGNRSNYGHNSPDHQDSSNSHTNITADDNEEKSGTLTIDIMNDDISEDQNNIDNDNNSENQSNVVNGNNSENQSNINDNYNSENQSNTNIVNNSENQSSIVNDSSYENQSNIEDQTGNVNDENEEETHFAQEFIMPNEIEGIPTNRIHISLIKNHVIRHPLPFNFFVKENSIIRFDLFSEEECISLVNRESMLVNVSHINEEDMLTFGDPFYVIVNEGEKFESLKKKLNNILVKLNGMTNQEFMRLAFFFGDSDQPGYQKKFLWKDMNVLDEMRSKFSYNNHNITLYILHRNKKSDDMSVKIYN